MNIERLKKIDIDGVEERRELIEDKVGNPNVQKNVKTIKCKIVEEAKKKTCKRWWDYYNINGSSCILDDSWKRINNLKGCILRLW